MSVDASLELLAQLFQRQQVADLDTLFRVLHTTSRMTVFRRLRSLGYVTSYSHNGRYYTLTKLPDFDADGLWRFQGICFSRHGSLKSTVAHLVQVADVGRTHSELSLRLQVRVHNALLDLVRQGHIGRELLGALYLYVSADAEVAATQVARRRQVEGAQPSIRVGQMRPALLVDVLVEVIRGSQSIVDPVVVCDRLAARAVTVSVAQVEDIYEVYGLKKTDEPPSPRSPR